MPDENKTVDIDTSGPDIDVELETSTPETDVSIPEEKETIREASTSTQETSDEKQETKTEEDKTEGEDQKDELEVYSKDVQRRIAKLTKKWREAERQKEEAITYARAQKQQADSISKKYSSLETNSLKDRESKLASAIEGAKARLAQAREAGDINLEVDVQREISRLGYEESRLLELKATREEMTKEEVIPTMNNVNIPRQPQTVVPDEKAEEWGGKTDGLVLINL
jgi:DNA repair ATPase RecN